MSSSDKQNLTIEDIGEEQLIKTIVREDSSVAVGPGDDSSAISLSNQGYSNGFLLCSTDVMVEGVHFVVEKCGATDVGFKAVESAISDIAAMGGLPQSIFLSLQLPSYTKVDWVEDLYKGVYQSSDDHQVKVLGGDVSTSKRIAITVTVVGHSKHSPVKRSGAQDGDSIWVSGVIGQSHAGLELLFDKIFIPEASLKEKLIDKHFYPSARVALGSKLAEKGIATSMIDVSDGLIGDALHIAKASELSMVIDIDEVLTPPIDEVVFSTAKAVTGGEDYELLFTAPDSKEAEIKALSTELGIELTRIGQVQKPKSKNPDVIIVTKETGQHSSKEWLEMNGLQSASYKHF